MSNAELLNAIERYQNTPLIVEGAKDKTALHALGFSRVFILNEHRGSLRERVERIAASLFKKEKVCILTDTDKRGRKLTACIAPILHELGFPTDKTLKKELRKAGVSHVEGLYKFLKD